MIFNIILIGIIILLFLILSMVWPPDSPWSPWWRTSRNIARKACKLAGISSKDTIYELGSGDGAFLLTASQEFGAKCIGIEIDPFRLFLSKVHIFLNGNSNNITLKRANFYSVNLSGATVVFVYLVPKALGRLRKKLITELKSGTKIISYRYKFPKVTKNLKLIKMNKKKDIFIYEVKK